MKTHALTDVAFLNDNYVGYDLRLLNVDGKPWFLAIEVCNAFGLEHTTEVIGSLDANDVQVSDITCCSGRPLQIVSAAGLYALASLSRESSAAEFSNWVVKDVVPSIPKNAGYVENPWYVHSDHLTDEERVIHALDVLNWDGCFVDAEGEKDSEATK